MRMYEEEELRREYEKERKFIEVPDGCKYPDCFHCVFRKCGVDKIRGESALNTELIRSLYKVGWKKDE